MVHDPVAALETLLTLGFERVLTSGCDSSALEGLPLIKRLIDQVHMISFLSSYESVVVTSDILLFGEVVKLHIN